MSKRYFDNITGIILAGGRSRRMGKDKSFILLSGKPLIEVLIDKLSSLFKDLIIISNKPHLYKRYGIRIVKDILPDRGPLGGIYTGLLSSSSVYNFFVACDMPFLNINLVRYISQESNDYDVIVPQYNGKLQPLCAIYSKNCIRPIETELSINHLRVTDFFRYVKVKIISSEEEFKNIDPKELCFVNMNTPQDYKKFKDSLTY